MDETEPEVGYYVAEVDADAFDFIRKALAAYTSGGQQAARAAAIQALADAVFVAGLPPERLNWAEIEAEAEAQGISLVDRLWDRMGRTHEEPWPKLRKREEP
jgi:hypothetical protein